MALSNNINTLHCSIYNILISDLELKALVDNKIFNYIPQNENYPFIVLGNTNSNFLGTFDISGSDIIYTVKIYGMAKSMKNIYDIHGRVRKLLDRNDIEIGGVDCCAFSIEYLSSLENPLADYEVNGRLIDISFRILIL